IVYIMTANSRKYSLLFLGTGSGGNLSVGSAAACLELDGQPILLIDCGPGTLNAFADAYQGALPPAIFLTHVHMDHIADLEILSVRARLAAESAKKTNSRTPPPIPLFAPLSIISTLHQRLATYPGTMAEGDHDFWQAFQLRPVSDEFIWHSDRFVIYPTRHHAPGSSYALHLPGTFFYTGDTRPVPEILHHHSQAQEVIFHDCGSIPNPSHTGLEDLAREYRDDIRQRFVLYHYANSAAADGLEQAGYRAARPGSRYLFNGDSAI
ncbi:MAG: MBL fold metallo-hydrolase, partial [Oleibacter sp.]|nr:MBL fold metallo-hydrolase [Thalassolituus sp.]